MQGEFRKVFEMLRKAAQAAQDATVAIDMIVRPVGICMRARFNGNEGVATVTWAQMETAEHDVLGDAVKEATRAVRGEPR